jgi:putative chitinase
MLNETHLHQLGIAPEWLDPLNMTFDLFGIHTVDEQAAFIGEYSYESNHFKTLEENLNYKPETLHQLWPNRFPSIEFAQGYAHQPEKIANFIYSNRMGNRTPESGDGYRFRGRGLPQLTGHDLYWHFGQYIGEDLVANPDLVATPKYAAMAGGWYWKTHNLSAHADAKDWTKVTKIINGGTFGLEQRVALIDHSIAVLSA